MTFIIEFETQMTDRPIFDFRGTSRRTPESLPLLYRRDRASVRVTALRVAIIRAMMRARARRHAGLITV